MRPNSIIGAHIVVNPLDHLPRSDVFVNIDIIIFQTTEKPFCTGVVECTTLSIHGNPDSPTGQQIQISLASKMASLIGVDDFRLTVG
jgi:hypothetical protein